MADAISIKAKLSDSEHIFVDKIKCFQKAEAFNLRPAFSSIPNMRFIF